MRLAILALAISMTACAMQSSADEVAGQRRPQCFGRVANVAGTSAGDDVLAGDPFVPGLDSGDDVARLRKGADTFVALSGEDRICGGRGDDRLNGGPGFDRINGGRGRDVCTEGEALRNCEVTTTRHT